MNHHRILGAAKAGNLETAKIKRNSVGSKFTRVEHKVDAKVGTKFSSPKKVELKSWRRPCLVDVWSFLTFGRSLVQIWSRFGRCFCGLTVFGVSRCLVMFSNHASIISGTFDLFCQLFKPWTLLSTLFGTLNFCAKLALAVIFCCVNFCIFFACTFCASVKIYILMAHLIM